MRNNMVRIGLLVSLLIGTAGVVGTQAQTLPPPPPLPPTPATGDTLKAIWANMLKAGMITDEQFQYALKNGRLPTDTVVLRSPIPVERQAKWKILQDRQAITVEDLANILSRVQFQSGRLMKCGRSKNWPRFMSLIAGDD